jgi:hypothetical protein
MRYTVTIRSILPREAIEGRLPCLTAGGAFQVRDLVHLGAGVWAVTLQPVRPGLAVGFGKVAELLVLLSREFEVEAVERSAVGTLAAAS